MKNLCKCLALALLAAFVFVGCAAKQDRLADASSVGVIRPPAGTKMVFEPISDPWEGYNRTIQNFNSVAVRYVALPLSRFWNAVLPQPLRNGLKNFSSNIKYPLHLFANLLQGNWNGSWRETERFAVNSTVGLLGFLDPATAWEIESSPDGFTDVFRHYGMGAGYFFNLPVAGPSTTRDTLGMILDRPFNVVSWLVPSGTGTAVNTTLAFNGLTEDIPTFDQFFTCNYDSYLLTKAFYVFKEKMQTQIPVQYEEDFKSADDTLNVLGASLRNPDFYYESKQHEAHLGNWRNMPYSCWPCPGSDRLVVILPGLGAHRMSDTVVYLAETLRQYNVSVITLSPTMSPDYFLNLKEIAPTGNFEADSEKLAKVLQCVIADYKERYETPSDARQILLGYSLGGANVLFLAQQDFQKQLPKNLHFDKFIAINPPIDVLEDLEKIDRFFDIPLSWPEDSREARAENLFLKLPSLMNGVDLGPAALTLEESQFLIAIVLRMALAEAIVALEEHRPSGHLSSPVSAFNKNSLWMEAMNIRAVDYMKDWVLPYYMEKDGETLEGLLARVGSMRTMEPMLRESKNVYMIHCANDFLLKSDDADWLKGVMGDRLTLFRSGGHLGEIPTLQFDHALSHLVLH